MTYDVVNRMATKTLPNGVKTVYSYDDLDRIINLTYTKANGTVLVSETYTRNAGGEPSKVLREDGSYTLYEYDAALRLSKEVVYNPAGGLLESIEYSYDLNAAQAISDILDSSNNRPQPPPKIVSSQKSSPG
jgi:YD repeat-containing protein